MSPSQNLSSIVIEKPKSQWTASSPINSAAGKIEEYPVSRYWIAIVIFFANMASATQFSSFSTVLVAIYSAASSLQSFYGIVGGLIILIFLSFLLATFCISRKGALFNLRVAATFTTLGAILIIAGISAVKNSFLLPSVTLAGIFFVGISQPFMLIVPTKAASVWFPSSERALANAVMSFGWMAGFGVSGAIFRVMVDLLWRKGFTSEAQLQLLVPQILCFISFALVMSTYLVADQEFIVKREKEPFRPNFSTGLMLFVFSTFISAFTVILIAFGVFGGERHSSTAVFVTGGLSMLIQGALADRFGIHVYLLKISCVFVIVGSVWNLLAPTFFYGFLVFMPFGAFPIIPLILELAVEANWPADEGSVAGTFWTCAFASSILIGGLSYFVSIFTIGVTTGLCFLSCLFVYVRVLKRRQEST